MRNKTDISIIIPLYYGRKFIPELIAQVEVCARYDSNICYEVIFSNDAPNDFLKDDYDSVYFPIKVINTDQNRGIHGARVRGFQNSSGEYVLFLDQDDKIAPEYFKSQLEKIGMADAVVCNALSGGRQKYNNDRPFYKTISRECMVNEGNMILSPGQVLLRRKAVPKVWIESKIQKNGADDWLLWLCMHSENYHFVTNPALLFIREVHYNNTSFDCFQMAESELEVVKIVEENQLLSDRERKNLWELLPELQKKRIKENEKFKKLFLIQNDWFRISIRGLSIADYLRKRNIKTAAIYGYGYLGKTLFEYLKNNNVKVVYIIDRNALFLGNSQIFCTLDDTLKPTDAVIVTLVTNNRENISCRIKEKLSTQIFWIEDIIADIAGQLWGD